MGSQYLSPCIPIMPTSPPGSRASLSGKCLCQAVSPLVYGARGRGTSPDAAILFLLSNLLQYLISTRSIRRSSGSFGPRLSTQSPKSQIFCPIRCLNILHTLNTYFHRKCGIPTNLANFSTTCSGSVRSPRYIRKPLTPNSLSSPFSDSFSQNGTSSSVPIGNWPAAI